MSEVRVIGVLDQNFGWDGERLIAGHDLLPGQPAPGALRGATASVREYSGRWRLLRDPLGINKLFWAEDGHGVAFAARPQRLIAAGWQLEDIRALPRGVVIDLPPPGEEWSLVPETWSSPVPIEPGAAATAIRAALDAYLAALAAAHRSAKVFVCLSGGLDSSGIATLASSYFPDVTAVSFDLAGGSGASPDREAAEGVAEQLGMQLLTADVDVEGLLAHLDTVLTEGIDWRDFNVHAGLVNAVLGDAIRQAAGDGEALVLTGDLPNEFLVDYHAERYNGETFYELPRLPPAALRTSLVRGLDTSHREVGVFAAFGLPVVQPYAVAVDSYLSLPAGFLELPDRKERLCSAVFGDRLPSFVLERPKARAQTGGDRGGGVLGACLDNGVDAAWLKRRFAELHRVEDPRELDRFIRAGRYRSAAPVLAGEAR